MQFDEPFIFFLNYEQIAKDVLFTKYRCR